MCMPVIGAVVGLASTAIGAMGAVQQGNATAATAKYNAKVADMNARISEQRATDALERGHIEEQNKRQEVARIKGRQQVAFAANGVDLGFGSPMDTMADTAVLGELDALTVRSNAAREAYDHRVDAANKTADAGLSRMNAKAAKTAGYLSAGGTLLTGLGNVATSFIKPRIGSYA